MRKYYLSLAFQITISNQKWPVDSQKSATVTAASCIVWRSSSPTYVSKLSLISWKCLRHVGFEIFCGQNDFPPADWWACLSFSEGKGLTLFFCRNAWEGRGDRKRGQKRDLEEGNGGDQWFLYSPCVHSLNWIQFPWHLPCDSWRNN